MRAVASDEVLASLSPVFPTQIFTQGSYVLFTILYMVSFIFYQI